MSKALELTKLFNQINFESTLGKLEAKIVYRDNHRQIMWDKL